MICWSGNSSIVLLVDTIEMIRTSLVYKENIDGKIQILVVL